MVERIENDYDPELGDWVTTDSRYRAVADGPRFAELDELLWESPERAWPLILELLAAVPEDVTFRVGGGPLERVVDRHGAAYVEELEREARENPRFRQAVLEVGLPQGDLPAEVEARLVAAFGPRFRLNPPADTWLHDPDAA